MTQQGKLILIRRDDQILTMLFNEKRPVTIQVSPAETSEAEHTSLVGNIYVGRVRNIVANIEAAFVEISKGQICYLPFSEIKHPVLTNRKGDSAAFDGKLRIGDELLVQVTRDALKTKQPALTTKLSFSGHYLVLSTGSIRLGISGKLSADIKSEIRTSLSQNGLMDEAGNVVQNVAGTFSGSDTDSHGNVSYGMVVRTNAGTLNGERVPMIEEWHQLETAFSQFLSVAMYRPCFTCLKSGLPGYLNTVKDVYRNDYEEILTDDPVIYKTVQSFCQEYMPGESVPVRLYEDKQLPLSKLYSVDTRLKEALSPRVWLKSGGYLIIEPTEALTVIDVNTGKYDVKKGNLEETVYRINLEAAEEIAAQMRLRNLSGIIIVDFINMEVTEHQEALWKTMRRLAANDPVRTGVIDITPLGLMEITRKKINKPLKEQLNASLSGKKS